MLGKIHIYKVAVNHIIES